MLSTLSRALAAVSSLFVCLLLTLPPAVAAPQEPDWQVLLRPDFDGDVRAIVKTSDGFFVAGAFKVTSGGPAIGIAKWDGAAWSPIGGELVPGQFLNPPSVTSLAWDEVGRRLFVAGNFSVSGVANTTDLAVWENGRWSAISSTPVPGARQVAWDPISRRLYVGGNFSIRAGDGRTASGIAMWNGSDWEAVGPGFFDPSYGLPSVMVWDADSRRLIVGGNLSRATASGPEPIGVAEWDGVRWQHPTARRVGSIEAIVPRPGLGGYFVAGQFDGSTRPDGFKNIALWTGTEWQALGAGLGAPGVFDRVSALAWDSATNRLFAGGDFDHAGLRGVAVFQNGAWSSMADGAAVAPSQRPEPIRALLWDASASRLIVGGAFSEVGGFGANRIAAWNGQWSALGPGYSAQIRKVLTEESTGHVFVAASPGAIDGLSSLGLLHWNGSRWADIAGNLTYASPSQIGEIYDLAWDSRDRTLYVGGRFTTIGGISADFIAAWRDGVWSPMGSGVNGVVKSLQWDETTRRLYVGGEFFGSKDDAAVGKVIYWSDGRWHGMGATASGSVGTMTLDRTGQRLFVAGQFLSIAGGYGGIYEWNGAAWRAVPGAVNSDYRALLWDPASQTLFASGPFSFDAGDRWPVLAWNGTNWRSIGSPTGGTVPADGLAWLPKQQAVIATTESVVGREGRPTVWRWRGCGWSSRDLDFVGALVPPAIQLPSGRAVFGGGFHQVAGRPARLVRVDFPEDFAAEILAPSGVRNFVEKAAPVAVFDDLQVCARTNLPTVIRARIATGYARGADRLLLPSPRTGVTSTWDEASATLTIAFGASTATDLMATLRAIAFESVADAPSLAERQVELEIGTPTVTTGSSSRVVTVTPTNDPPRITLLSPTPVVEDAVSRLDGFQLSDPDGDVFLSARVSVVAGTLSVEAFNASATPSRISDQEYAISGTVSAINEYIRDGRLRYLTAQNANGTARITVRVRDPRGVEPTRTLAEASFEVPITPTNDAPEFTGTPAIAGTPEPGATLSLAPLPVRDIDGDVLTTTYRWFRDAASIPGATGPTLVLGDGDADRTIAVEVTVRDAALSATSRTPGVQIRPLPLLVAVDDRVAVRENAGPVAIRVLANDVLTASRMAAGGLQVDLSPRLGSLRIDGGGSQSIIDDVVVYTPNANVTGVDSFVYRICEAGGRCEPAWVTITIGLVSEGRIALLVDADSGWRDIELGGLRALPTAEFVSTGARRGIEQRGTVLPDPTPRSPWDGSLAGTFSISERVLVPGGSDDTVRVHVEVESPAADVDLYLGIDSNSDRIPQESEVRCVAAMTRAIEFCDLAVPAAAGGSVTYWAMVHNRDGSPSSIRMDRYVVMQSDRAPGLTVTGPGRLSAGESFKTRLSWRDPTLVDGARRLAYIGLKLADGSFHSWIPVRLEARAPRRSPMPLESGARVDLALAAGSAHEVTYIDVPPGMARLDVTTSSATNVDLYLARVEAPVASGATPTVPVAPARNLATAIAATPSGNESLTVDNPPAGRWYVTTVNTSGGTANLVLRATLAGTGPALRSGGYFNPARSGNGLFVYPAGNQWAGLWYTYLQDGSPTWYYLQAQAPGATGIWRGTIYRSAWKGSSNFLTPVGEATVTPQSNTGFTFSYTLDGETGSEAYENFGGGCPTFAGARLDASGHWFDPARAGSGYSVQFFPNYEFYTVFGYDAQGVPRYLIAERSGIGGANTTLPLEQNTGACPLCDRTGNPVRSTVGTLTRTLGNGTLQRIQLTGTYTAGVPGTWAANDAVIPLGTLQGCATN